MKIAILGTGVVGQTLAAKLDSLGHEVTIGTRDPAATLARADKDAFGNPPFPAWAAAHPRVKLEPFATAAARGEVVINALSGAAALPGLALVGEANLAGKILIDVSNPLDFSKGFPPSLTVCNTDSLGEQIQRKYPDVKVVKALNTMGNDLMIDPGKLNGGDHDLLMCGNDAGAKGKVTEVLQSFGWKREHIIDLGDISGSRAQEAWLLVWARMYGVLKTGFQLKIVR